MIVTKKVHFARGRRGKQAAPAEAAAKLAGRVPRVSRLMALAIKFDQLIRDGAVADQAELARLGHVSRARLSQIMNLLSLAPDIQEGLLFLPPTVRGRDAVAETDLRPIAAEPAWGRQRGMWGKVERPRQRSRSRRLGPL